MFKRPRTDFWQVGIVPAPIAEIDEVRLASLRSQIVWMPPAGDWRYLADPFALRRGDTLHVFVEAFDYRTKHGTIERHDYDLARRTWSAPRTVLALPFHLSYPFVFEHEGHPCMLPECQQSGEIALYRGDPSLDRWERWISLLPGVRGVDSSLLQHGGRWWMFYAIVGKGARDRRELHVAHAPALSGPWTPFAGNPVRVDLGGARPAGSPYVDARGDVLLPTQDCSQTYGGAVQMLRFKTLSPERIEVEADPIHLTGALVSDDYTAGMHTLSACGEYTLVDVKRIDHSRVKQWLDLKRRARRLARRLTLQAA